MRNNKNKPISKISLAQTAEKRLIINVTKTIDFLIFISMASIYGKFLFCVSGHALNFYYFTESDRGSNAAYFINTASVPNTNNTMLFLLLTVSVWRHTPLWYIKLFIAAIFLEGCDRPKPVVSFMFYFSVVYRFRSCYKSAGSGDNFFLLKQMAPCETFFQFSFCIIVILMLLQYYVF